MKYFLFLIISLLFASPIYGQQILSQTSVHFDTDKYHLTAAAKNSLVAFTSVLKEKGAEYELIIEAHTDSRASQAYNTALSQRRAKSVSEYLKKQELDITNLSVNVFGEDNPSFSNNNEDGMGKNRRVDVKAIAISNEISELDNFLATESQKRTQTFMINNEEKNLITGNGGTRIYIDENTFVFENGRILTTNDIKISLKEAYTLEDIMIFQLSTHTEKQLLETGGMIFLQATSQGQILKIQEGKPIKIGLPTDKLKEGMQLFDGVSIGNDIQWNATNQEFAITPFEFIVPESPDYPISSFRYFVKRKSDGQPMLTEKQHDYYRGRISELVLYIELIEPKYPKMPTEPRIEQIRLDKNYQKSMFTSKRKIEKEVQEKYKRRMNVYKRKLAIYNRKLAEYKRDSTNFPNWIAYQKQMMDIATGKLMEEFDANFKKTGNVANQKLQNYFFTQNKLGWINCDRFINTPPEQKITLAINDKDKEEELIYVVFEDINACIKPKRKDETLFMTQLIPKSAKVTIIGLKVRNGKNYIAKHQTIANAKTKYDLVYEPVQSSKELTNLLKL